MGSSCNDGEMGLAAHSLFGDSSSADSRSGGSASDPGEPQRKRASDQLRYLKADLDRMVNGKPWRWFSVSFRGGTWSIVGHRLSRLCFLAFGRRWQVVHTLLAPIHALVRPFGAGLEIHYKADVGPGLLLLHPTLGLVISGHARIGRNCTLTGGNCIGGRSDLAEHGMTIGDHVSLGVNAVILGPGQVGDRVIVGAGSILIGDAPAGATMVGAPARSVRSQDRSLELPGATGSAD